MTAEDFLDWLRFEKDCHITPTRGNCTGRAVKIVRYHGNIERYYYFQGPFGNHDMPRRDIRKICIVLWVDPKEYLGDDI